MKNRWREYDETESGLVLCVRQELVCKACNRLVHKRCTGVRDRLQGRLPMGTPKKTRGEVA